LDFTQPIALMLMGILGHIGDHDEARSILKRLLDPLPSGSYLALKDGTNVISQAFAQAQQRYNESGALPYHLRSPEQIAGFSTGWSWSNLVSCRFHDGEPIPPTLAVTFPRRSMPSVV
jgi:hypothetical protein